MIDESMSTTCATPILYINMGGEMLYVLQQRLQTQKISPDKTIQVMNEVIYAMLNPKQLSMIFAHAPLMALSQLRPILERVVLSSIMKLDANSMGKLFDLMIMMVKYQLATLSGPRELLLSTLNHLDAIRDMAMERSLSEHVDACHRLLIDTYGQMTYKQLWQIRDECLREISEHNVRVSILLRLGMQNQDASFNRLVQSYDEKYQERKEVLENVKIIDYVDEDGALGQLSLFGDRATLLGKNAYCSSYGHSQSSAGSSSQSLNQVAARSSKAMRQELEILATQLGKEETAPTRPFSLHLFGHHVNDNDKRNTIDVDCSESNNANEESPREGQTDLNNDNERPLLDRYKNDLIRNVDSEFADNDNSQARSDTADLLNFLDIM